MRFAEAVALSWSVLVFSECQKPVSTPVAPADHQPGVTPELRIDIGVLERAPHRYTLTLEGLTEAEVLARCKAEIARADVGIISVQCNEKRFNDEDSRLKAAIQELAKTAGVKYRCRQALSDGEAVWEYP